MKNKILEEVKQIIRNPFVWPGGYPAYIIMADGELICSDCARKEYKRIAKSTIKNDHDGWKAVGAEILWENDSVCCHCNKVLESAYGDINE